MILPKSGDAFHQLQLYHLLAAILDEKYLSCNLFFKGGSCAAMLGWLDRFSLDLDFDLATSAEKKVIVGKLLSIFRQLNLKVKKRTNETPFFVLAYPTKTGQRNTLKLGMVDQNPKANDYKAHYLADIDRFCLCQTRETMVANKLVALIDRYEKHRTIAGRDVYDIHYFLSHGFHYKKAVIEERRKTKASIYFKELLEFIQKKVTDRIIGEDLSYLLPYEKFKMIRKTLKTETLLLLRQEIERLLLDKELTLS